MNIDDIIITGSSSNFIQYTWFRFSILNSPSKILEISITFCVLRLTLDSCKMDLRYSSCTLSHGLHLTKTAQHWLIDFCDVDWEIDTNDRRSTSCSCIFLGLNLISWWSKKQLWVAQSSIEVEYRSFAECRHSSSDDMASISATRALFETPRDLCSTATT